MAWLPEDLVQARSLLTAARTLEAAAEARLLADTGALLSAVRTVLARNMVSMVERTEQVLALYDGLPVRMNTMELLGVAESEVVHTQLLAWLLDPGGAHGLGAGLLAHVLSLSRSPSAHRLVLNPAGIDAIVQAEVALDAGIIDIVIVCHGLLVGLELKVWDTEHEIVWRGSRHYQTSCYRRQLEDPIARSGLLARLGHLAIRLAGPRPEVCSFLVRPHGGPPAKDEAGTITLSWLEIERALGVLERRLDIPADARGIIRMFRSTLVCRSGAYDPLIDRLIAARALVDHRGLHLTDPSTVFFGLEHLHSTWSDHGGP